MATTDIPTVNGSVIMIISRLASGLAPATVTPNMDWIITARIRTAHTPAVIQTFFARWSSTWRHLRKSDLLIAVDYTVRPLLIDENTSCRPHCRNKKVAYRQVIASNRR